MQQYTFNLLILDLRCIWVRFQGKQGEQLLFTSCTLPWRMHPFKMGSTLKGKSSLVEKQSLFFKS